MQLVVAAQLARVVLAERRRAEAQVDGHVEDAPGAAANQLDQRRGQILVVNAAQHMPLRAGVIVLDEVVSNTELCESAPPVRLQKEPALIPVNGWLDQHRTLQPAWQLTHDPAM